MTQSNNFVAFQFEIYYNIRNIIDIFPYSGVCYVTNLAAVGIFWRKQMTTMIALYDVSEMRKSLIDFWEMRYLRFWG